MKNNSLFYKLAVSLTLILLTSCSDQFVKGVYIASNNEYSLSAETTSLQSIPSEGGEIDMEIQASNMVKWEIQDLPSWISASPISGTGRQEIKLNVEPNESHTTSRSQIFNIVSMNSDWLVTLPVLASQSKKNAFLTLSPLNNSFWTFDSEGGNKELSVSSNIEWKAECESDFITLSKNSGNGDSSIIVTVESYKHIDVTDNRSASIYFKETSNDEVMQVLNVTQTPLQTTVETETINVEFQRLQVSRSFALGEVRGEYSVKSDAPWLNISKNDETKIDVTLSASENENDAERSTNAYVFLGNSNNIKYVFAVKQQGNTFVIETDNIVFESTGGAYNVKVDSNTTWKTTNYNDWITVEDSYNSCTISVPENNSLDFRSGNVFFSKVNTEGDFIGKTTTLHVSQKGKTLSTDSKILQFGPESSTLPLNIESDTRWTLTTDNNWIQLSVTEGVGNRAVAVSVSENTTTSNRVGSLKLDCLGKIFEISVVQESAFVNTGSTSIEIEAIGGNASVTLSSNVEWYATSSEPWLRISPQSGNGETTLELSAPYNETANPRTAVVTISSKAGDIKINVSQKAPTLMVSQSSVEFDYPGGSSSPIIVTADGNYNISTSNNWISYDQTDNTITLNVEKNENLDSREGNVKISLTEAPISTNIIIKQNGAPKPNVSESGVTLISATPFNWTIRMSAQVSSSISVKEVGFIWNKSYVSPVSVPTLYNCDGKIVATNLNGREFSATTPSIYSERYVRVRAYAIDGNNNIYYSSSKEVTP